jgi:hypothetical protein
MIRRVLVVLTGFGTAAAAQWLNYPAPGIPRGRKVISVDRNSRGRERLGRAVLPIAEGVRITLLERSRVRNAAVF